MRRAWPKTQAAFAAAIMDSSLPPPPGVIECSGVRGREGFAVYRNNVLMGFIRALQERFPVTCRLVGEEFFRAMARAYVSEHPPHSPLLMHYGDDLPDFIDDFTPADEVPYLSDVARLEAARSEAYHASERRSLPAQVLASTPPEALLGGLTLHPSTHILRSMYPVAEIWAAHQSSGAVTSPAHWDAQDLLIVRPDSDVHVYRLGPGVYVFIKALLNRMCVQDAAEIALDGHPLFDAGKTMVDLFDMGAVIAVDSVGLQEI
jgi:hypothetical protein